VVGKKRIKGGGKIRSSSKFETSQIMETLVKRLGTCRLVLEKERVLAKNGS